MNNTAIGHEKPSSIKKLMKPHKNILRLVIERPQLHDRSYMGQHLPSSTNTSELLLSGGGSKTPPDSPPPSSSSYAERKRSSSYSHYGRGSRRQSQQSQVYYTPCSYSVEFVSLVIMFAYHVLHELAYIVSYIKSCIKKLIHPRGNCPSA